MREKKREKGEKVSQRREWIRFCPTLRHPREIWIKQNDPRLFCPRKRRRPLPFVSVSCVRAANIYGHLARRSRGVNKLEVNPSVGA